MEAGHSCDTQLIAISNIVAGVDEGNHGDRIFLDLFKEIDMVRYNDICYSDLNTTGSMATSRNGQRVFSVTVPIKSL